MKLIEMKFIKPIIISIILGGLLFPGREGLVQAQRVKSKTASIHLDYAPARDTIPPVVKVVNPIMEDGKNFQTAEREIEIIVKASDDSRISFVRVNRKVPIEDKAGIYFVNIELEPGLNELRIQAMDANENVFDQLYLIDYAPPLITLADRIYSEAQYYGLIIGVNEYQNENLEDLNHPCADAKSLYQVLTTNYNFDKKNTVFLRNPTRKEILQEFDALREKVDTLDNLLVFYAGHGSYDERANTGYWLPSDASRTSKANWYQNSTLLNQLRAIRSKHTLLITDACFAGSIMKFRSVDMMKENKYDLIYEEPSRKALTSGNMTEVPDESAFIKYLIKYLKENQTEYLSAEELYMKLKDPVMYNNKIKPVYGVIPELGSENGDFVFLRDIRK